MDEQICQKFLIFYLIRFVHPFLFFKASDCLLVPLKQLIKIQRILIILLLVNFLTDPDHQRHIKTKCSIFLKTLIKFFLSILLYILISILPFSFSSISLWRSLKFHLSDLLDPLDTIIVLRTQNSNIRRAYLYIWWVIPTFSKISRFFYAHWWMNGWLTFKRFLNINLTRVLFLSIFYFFLAFGDPNRLSLRKTFSLIIGRIFLFLVFFMYWIPLI